MILAIDPGSTESGYAVLDEVLRPIEFGKIKNEELLNKIGNGCFEECQDIAIEMVACYGMAVGATVFDTCVWIGRFVDRITYELCINPVYIYRKDEKMNLCHTMKAKDSNIRQALIDRFGIVGVKKKPGWFYGVSKDMWAAVAVGVTYHDLYLKESEG